MNLDQNTAQTPAEGGDRVANEIWDDSDERYTNEDHQHKKRSFSCATVQYSQQKMRRARPLQHHFSISIEGLDSEKCVILFAQMLFQLQQLRQIFARLTGADAKIRIADILQLNSTGGRS